MPKKAPSQNIVLVGGESLLGREIRELLSDSKLAGRLKLIGGGEEGSGILTEDGGEPVYISSLDGDTLSDAQLVFLAGSAASSRRAFGLAGSSKNNGVPIDLSGALEDLPSARLRAPALEPPDYQVPRGAVQVIAHPAAIALATFFSRLSKQQAIRRSVVQIFEPASERGQAGITELQQQTAALLTFKKLPQNVFDAQLSFNLLAQYGEDSATKLEEIEMRIERHLATLFLLSGQPAAAFPMPSLRLVQAPVFHGHSFSIWVEFSGNADPQALTESLASEQIDVRANDQEVPTNAGVAGRSGITVGAISVDRNNPHACWFWVVADNIRIAAENAVKLATDRLGLRDAG